jgi:hypothetical protein
MEEWRKIEGFDDYEVSNLGRVRSLKFGKERILKQVLDNGYWKVSLSNKKAREYTIHRLVALAFIPNPDNLPEIDHIDIDGQNNSISNLRWADRSINSLNRGNWGECPKYIHRTPYGFRCYLFSGTIRSKTFKTLEECVRWRDEYLMENLPRQNT